MKVLIAPNSMKGSLNAFDFADTVEEALLISLSDVKVRKIPVADGGDFTGEVLAKALNAKIVNVEVFGPLGKKIISKYFVSDKTAIIEMADASGMKLIDKNDLNPLKTSSIGTGELINDAILNGCNKIFLAIGGSATVDGGMGMLEALGFGFFDKNGTKLPGNGNNLGAVFNITVPKIISEVSIKIICDVDNPLLGENGAAAVFGPQKGATPEMVVQLEKGLKNWAEIMQKKTGKEVAMLKGTGAAGGIALPLISVFNAEIVSGADFVLTVLDFDKHVKWADVIITGEGKLDAQTLNNKAPFAVLQWARKENKPVFAFGGRVEMEAAYLFDDVFSISDEHMDVEYAMKNAQKLLYRCTLENAKKIETQVAKGNK